MNLEESVAENKDGKNLDKLNLVYFEVFISLKEPDTLLPISYCARNV